MVMLILAKYLEKLPLRMGKSSLTGRRGKARVDINPRGIVLIHGEDWSAELAPGEKPLPAGTRVIVVGTRGLSVVVRKAGK
jgi:membrane protein implicated in regulation of membrane protease activity